ncbi:MAG TPA: anti-sigma regulatory factor [Bacteroidales bacterium]|jgi:anti-sigma regulatory factor (Ser/Thr protein kinase)|nr:anti-sigma regulatory factor [Bacteroidales bacterium]
MQYRYKIAGGDFSNAGAVASSVKKTLRQLNIDHRLSKRIVIALYEGEVNVVAHAYSGIIDIDIDHERIKIRITDKGPGIVDIAKAMEEGYSTASTQVREMGFGAGMGLSNMKKNSDSMQITSEPGIGTAVELTTYLNGNEG